MKSTLAKEITNYSELDKKEKIEEVKKMIKIRKRTDLLLRQDGYEYDTPFMNTLKRQIKFLQDKVHWLHQS